MSPLRPSIDLANYQQNVPLATFQRWKAEGLQTVTCGTDGNPSFPTMFAQQIATARAAHIERAEPYVFLYTAQQDANGIARRTHLKLDLIDEVGGFGPLDHVWLDCEQRPGDAPGAIAKPAAEIVGLIALARDIVIQRGYTPGVYTSRGWWRDLTADSHGFANLDLWLAWYNSLPDLDFPPAMQFGGFTRLFRHQYTDKGVMGDYGPLDLNVEEQIVYAPTPTPEPGPTPEPPPSPTPPPDLAAVRRHLATIRGEVASAEAALGGS